MGRVGPLGGSFDRVDHTGDLLTDPVLLLLIDPPSALGGPQANGCIKSRLSSERTVRRGGEGRWELLGS